MARIHTIAIPCPLTHKTYPDDLTELSDRIAAEHRVDILHEFVNIHSADYLRAFFRHTELNALFARTNPQHAFARRASQILIDRFFPGEGMQ